jgi:putative transposase
VEQGQARWSRAFGPAAEITTQNWASAPEGLSSRLPKSGSVSTRILSFRATIPNAAVTFPEREMSMTIPYRGTSRCGTYFITASSFEKQSLLQSDRMAALFIDVLLHYQKLTKYHLHEFVVMPNHFHLLITPISPVTLEKTVQFIKGAFSYRAKKELAFAGEIWQTSFHDRRVRDANEYAAFRHYIHINPVRRGLVTSPEEFPFSSVRGKLDDVPQWLKPAA